MSNVIAQNPTSATYSGATSVNKTFASACTNPSLIVAALTLDNATDPTAVSITISDGVNAGNYADDATVSRAGGSNGKVSIRSIQNTATSALTVTATLGATINGGVLKTYEVTGAAISSVVGAANTGTGGSTSMSVTLSTVPANSTIVAVAFAYPNATLSVDSGFTQAYAAYNAWTGYSYAEHDEDSGVAGNFTLTMNNGTPADWCMAAVAYKSAIVPVPPMLGANAGKLLAANNGRVLRVA